MFATWILPKECHSLLLSCSRSYLNNSISVPQMKFEVFLGRTCVYQLFNVSGMNVPTLCHDIVFWNALLFHHSSLVYLANPNYEYIVPLSQCISWYTQVYTLHVYITYIYIYLYFPPLSVFVRLRWSYHLSNSDLCLVSDSCSKHFYPFKD